MAAVTLFRCVHLGVFWWWGCGVCARG